MQLRIRTRHLELSPDALRAIERRLRLALGRYVADIGVAHVLLTTSPPVRGAAGRRGRILARLRGGERVLVEDQADGLETAIRSACWRLDHRLRRPAARAGARRSRAHDTMDWRKIS